MDNPSDNILAQGPILFSFPAGRMDRIKGTRRLKPDLRKGTVLVRLAEDEEGGGGEDEEDQVSILNLFWIERPYDPTRSVNSGARHVVDEYLIMPEEAVFEAVPTDGGGGQGKVFILRWKETARKVFFWMQDKNQEKVEGYAKRLNELLANPRSKAGSGGTTTSVGAFPGPQDLASAWGSGGNSMDRDDELQSGIDLLRSIHNSRGGGDGAAAGDANMDLLRRMLDPSGSAAGSAESNTSPATLANNQNRAGLTGVAATSDETQGRGASTLPGAGTEAAPSAGQGQGPGPLRAGEATNGTLSTAQNSLTESQLAEMSRILTSMSVPQQQEGENAPAISLLDVLSPARLNSLLTDPQTRSALFPHLPASSQESISSGRTNDHDELRNIVTSAPFRQSIRTLQYALETGQLGHMMHSLGLPESAGRSVEHFLRAIQERHSSSSDQSGARHDTMDTT